MVEVYDFNAKLINGEDKSLGDYKGKTIVVVNTASQCGFTPQYGDLQNLYEKYEEKGVTVLAFPCNQFGGQEPGESNEIQEFCDLRFKVKFPIFDKVDVNGENTHPLFSYLKEELPGLLGSKKVKWNFTKFVIDKDGKPFKRYAPKDPVSKIEEDLKNIL